MAFETVPFMSFDKNWNFLLYIHWNFDWVRHWFVHWIRYGFGYRHRVWHWYWYFDSYFNWIWYWFFYRYRYWFYYSYWVWFGYMYWIRAIDWDRYLDWVWYTNLFDYWVRYWVWYWNRDFFSDCDVFDMTVSFVISDGSEPDSMSQFKTTSKFMTSYSIPKVQKATFILLLFGSGCRFFRFFFREGRYQTQNQYKGTILQTKKN